MVASIMAIEQKLEDVIDRVPRGSEVNPLIAPGSTANAGETSFA